MVYDTIRVISTCVLRGHESEFMRDHPSLVGQLLDRVYRGLGGRSTGAFANNGRIKKDQSKDRFKK